MRPYSTAAAVILLAAIGILAPTAAETSMSITATAATWAEALQRLKTLSPGGTLLLKPGDYGDAVLSDAHFDPPIRIMSEAPDDPAVFTSLQLREVIGVTFDQFRLALSVDASTKASAFGVSITDSAGVSIENATIIGGNAVSGVSADVNPETTDSRTTYIGHPIGSAIYVRRSNEIQLVGNSISHFHRGVTLFDGRNAVVRGNLIRDLRSTPFRAIDFDQITITNNHFHSFRPVNFGGHGDHGDMMHFRQSKKRVLPVRDIVVANNLLRQGAGAPILGVVFASRRGAPGYENIRIERNVIHNGDAAGIVLEGVRNSVVFRNTLAETAGQGTKAPIIRVWFDCADLVVSRNVTPGIYVQPERNAVASIHLRGNLIARRTHEDGVRHIGTVFRNSLVANTQSRRDDFRLEPDLQGRSLGAVD